MRCQCQTYADPFELQLDFPYFLLGSRKAGWRLQMPYYFMIWDMKQFTATNGFETDLVMASTSFARHGDGKGHSQATLMFIFSGNVDLADFEAFWLDQLGIGPGDITSASPAPGARHFEVYDEAQQLRKEATLRHDRTGSIMLAYLGRDGAFQANRASYLDFIKSLRLEDDSPSPAAGGEPPIPQRASVISIGS